MAEAQNRLGSFSEGLWDIIRGIGNYVGLGDALGRWVSNDAEHANYSSIINKLEKALNEKIAASSPQDYTAMYNKISELQNALYNVSGPAARQFQNFATNMANELSGKIKKQNAIDTANQLLYQQGTTQIQNARNKLKSGEWTTKDQMPDLIKDIEGTLNMFNGGQNE